jgi:hypothetical protein
MKHLKLHELSGGKINAEKIILEVKYHSDAFFLFSVVLHKFQKMHI